MKSDRDHLKLNLHADDSGNGFPHVAGSSTEAVHQLCVWHKKHQEERKKQGEPVRPQVQLHPQEERQPEEKPSLQQPEGPRFLAQGLPGGTEEGEVRQKVWSMLKGREMFYL